MIHAWVAYYIITTVTWSKESNHVKLTGMDQQTAQYTKRQVRSDDPCLSIRCNPIFQTKLL
jgi:hypothetical protein